MPACVGAVPRTRGRGRVSHDRYVRVRVRPQAHAGDPGSLVPGQEFGLRDPVHLGDVRARIPQLDRVERVAIAHQSNIKSQRFLILARYAL